MRVFLVLQICQLLQIARSQVKNCYDWDGTMRLDYPCDPSANVSSCCGSGGRCVTNLFCVTALNAQVVGTCTDQSWTSEACPWLLNKSTAALNFDHFKYSLNTTSCLDNTICPGPQNQSCCDAKNGKKEIDFGNNAIMPTQMKDLSSYYEAAGYTIPSRTAESSTSGSTAQSTPSSSITTVSTSTSVSRPSSMPSNGRDQPSGGSGLSTSAKAFVGAAASIVALLLLVSCLYLIRRHRLKHREKYPARNTEPEGTQNSQVVEVRRDLSELQGSPAGVEMDDTTTRNCGELAADRGQG